MDIAIVGNGPAGWSCAMTARMRGLSATVIAPAETGGWLSGAERIDNYPGLPQIPGKELLERFRQQALALGAEEKNALVRQIMPSGDRFLLLAENDVLEARTVVLCMGAARPVLLPGEEELLGGGVSRQGERILSPIREYVAEHCFGGREGAVPIIAAAKLGNEAGIIGAAAL